MYYFRPVGEAACNSPNKTFNMYINFRPVDVKNKVKGANYRTTARFPIRSGPKQFAAYLNGNVITYELLCDNNLS